RRRNVRARGRHPGRDRPVTGGAHGPPAGVGSSPTSCGPVGHCSILSQRQRAMKLDALVPGDQALLYMERYVDEGAKDYSPFAARTEVAPQYQPRSHRTSFDLVTVHAPPDRVSVFQADPSDGLREFYVRPDAVLFAVHPETW